MDQIDPIKKDKVLKSKRSNLQWEEIKNPMKIGGQSS